MWKTTRVAISADEILEGLNPNRPVLLAGPTASGKSALAFRLAEVTGGPIVNADALQVYEDWRILTARPTEDDESRWPHRLYGHVPGDRPYSVGAWLRDLAPLLNGPPPVIVGGTGLYFSALTEGLAEIPEIPDAVRAEATRRMRAEGPEALLGDLDTATAFRIDRLNPVRIQRAWEVLTATGRGLADWQDDTGPALLPLDRATPLVVHAPKDWLTPRIEARFDQMVAQGALDEARENAATWRPDLPSAKAIGAAELIAHVRGDVSLDEARAAAVILTRRYAKRQRSWFRARMGGWTGIDLR